MTNKEYKKLCEDYKGKVSFTWSHWIDKKQSYSLMVDFCREHIKDEARIASTNIANIYNIGY